jgi:adhesin transport system membrane fusion protein
MPGDQRPSENLFSLPVELRHESSARLARKTTYIIGLTIIALISWAAVSPVEEVAVAPGKIVPSTAISDINHLEGGIVDAVLVREGDRVEPGQLLLRMNPSQAAADLSQLEVRVANFTMKRERLNASMGDHQPEFGPLGQRYRSLREEHLQAFIQERAQAIEQRQQLQLAVDRLAAQLTSAKAEEDNLAGQVRLQNEQAIIRKQSYAKGYTAKTTLLQAQSLLEQAKQRLLSAKGHVVEVTKMHKEAVAKLQEVAAERLRKLSEERADVAAQLTESEETLAKYRDRVTRLDVISPIEGLVHSLVYNVAGEVVKPGSLVAQIVPGNGGILAEVELQPRDIGHVRLGNPAEIKLSNYDTNVIGIIQGEVKLISATTFETKEGHPFYKVRIALSRDHFDADGRHLPISPGTTLDAQILTGSKTLLRYMLKPVYQSFDTVFTER